MLIKLEQLAERVFVFGLTEPVGWHFLNLRVSRVFAEVAMRLGQRLPTLDVEGRCRTFHVFVVDGELFLSHGIEHIRSSITDYLFRESDPFSILVGLLKPLELLKVDFEILLAPHPILMVLRHLERVLNRW